MSETTGEEWLTLGEAELIVGVPADDIRLWIVRGVRLPSRKLFRLKAKRERGRWMVTESALSAYVDAALSLRGSHPRQWPEDRQALARTLCRQKQPA